MKAMLQSSAMIRKGLRAISGLEVMKSWSSLILFNTMYSICKIKTEIIIKPDPGVRFWEINLKLTTFHIIYKYLHTFAEYMLTIFNDFFYDDLQFLPRIF